MGDRLPENGKRGLRAFADPDKLIWLLLLLLFLERVAVFFELGPAYNSGADEVRYIPSGITFAHTGMISYGGPFPTAMIMPGITVVIGLFSLVFGEGLGLWVSLRFAWMLLGTATAWVVYRAVKLISNGWCGLLAALAFALPNMAWMNNVVLTETPYMLFFVLCVYYTLCMERGRERKYFVGYTLSFMAALMFRANILLMVPLTGAYLLLRRQSPRLLLRRGLALAGVLLLFVVPWTVRNYLWFDAFIPLTSGAGNPMLLGSYQGEGYPADEELDYAANVDAVMRQEYADYYRQTPRPYTPEEQEQWGYYIQQYDPNGELKELCQGQYLSLTADGIKARYRMKVWFENDPAGFLKSFLFIKPRWMLNWAWAWEEVLNTSYETLHRISQVNMLFCALTALLALWLKKYRAPILFLGAVYVAYVYMNALAFVSDRYGAVLMPLRYMIAGLGFGLLWEAARRLLKRRKAK